MIYHIEPIYESFIWGGRKLIDTFSLNTERDNIGTIYSVIAIPDGLDNLIRETGEHLSAFYKKHSDVFNCTAEEFPVRMTITCNEGKQSFQLHPDDEYAMRVEKKRGKVSGSVTLTESDRVRSFLFGNQCKSKEEVMEKIKNKDWENLFRIVRVKDGDFMHTPAGVIHGGEGDGEIAVTFGTNGDLTYRFYDYDRNDPSRPLHLDKVYDCIHTPEPEYKSVHVEPIKVGQLQLTEYHNIPGEYTARKIEVNGEGNYQQSEFYFLLCAQGLGMVDGENIKAAETLLIPSNYGEIVIKGNMTLYLLSYRDV